MGYYEVPQESMGFSPFELIYGCDVIGPLEHWVANDRCCIIIIN